MKHLIGKQIMDFKMLHAGDVFDVSNQLSALYWQQIVPLLENLFDQYSNREEIIRIDRLQIDLGHLTAEQLRQGKFLDILKRLLEQELSRLLQENNAKAEKLPIAYGQFEQWLFFLEKGYFPWNSYQPEEDWQGSILENLATNTFAVDQLRQLVIRNQVVTERMVLQYAPSFLKTIVELYTGRKQNDLVEAAKELRVLARQEPSLKPSRQLIKWSTRTLELFYWQKIIEEAIKRKSTREPRELIGQFFQRYYTSQTLNVLSQALEGKQFPTLAEALTPFVKAQEQNSPSPEREKPQLRPLEFPDTEVGKGILEGFDTDLKNKPSNLERKEEALDNESEPKREKTSSKREDKPQVMDQEGAEAREVSIEDQPKRTIESAPEGGEERSPKEQSEAPNENLKSKESLGNEPGKSEADGKRKLEKGPSKSEQKPETGQETERKEASINKQKDLEIFPEEEIDSVTEEPRKQSKKSQKGADSGEANEGEATSEGNPTPLEESLLDLGKTTRGGEEIVEPSKDSTPIDREEQGVRPGEKQANFDDRTFEHPDSDPLAEDELGGSPKKMAFTREDVFPELEAEEEIPSYLQQDKAPPYYQISSNEEIYLANAGIILVHPFLVRYFENIGFWDRRIFKNEKARHRAIKLLHYLVTGESRIPEHQMVLPKVLCGLPIDVPIDHRLRLTKKQKSEGDAMLEAVIEHWGVLGKTSIAGLREGFLRREGKLSFSNGAWNLKVEQQTLDILLDKLPWGIGIIKLPWMLDMLKVEWR